jgi:hypothetical protein
MLVRVRFDRVGPQRLLQLKIRLKSEVVQQRLKDLPAKAPIYGQMRGQLVRIIDIQTPFVVSEVPLCERNSAFDSAERAKQEVRSLHRKHP